MLPEERIRRTLEQMAQAARDIAEFIADADPDKFESDKLLRSAVERQIEVLGEGARRIPDEFRALHPDIAWRAIAGQRNVLAHEYDDIRIDVIWKVASIDTPALLDKLDKLLAEDLP